MHNGAADEKHLCADWVVVQNEWSKGARLIRISFGQHFLLKTQLTRKLRGILSWKVWNPFAGITKHKGEADIALQSFQQKGVTCILIAQLQHFLRE